MKLARLAPALLAAGLFVAACGGSTPSGGATPSANVPSDLSISSFTADFSYMSKLTDLTKAGKGMVGVILPDTTSSARYVAFDQPYLTKAFQTAGYTSAQFKIDNAQGQEAQQLSIAQADITAGATLVGDQIATDWKNDVGGTIFQQQFTAHPEINATIEANDGLGNAVIQVLKNKKVGAKKIPTTGQDATLDGMVNVLTDYQCGSVYKAVYLEAQDAVALATVLRAGATPPSGLVNGTTAPPSGVSGNQQPASLLVPVWVDKSNMEATVIKDKFIDVATLCSKAGASVCSANNIS